jgi:hypothetical protein
MPYFLLFFLEKFIHLISPSNTKYNTGGHLVIIDHAAPDGTTPHSTCAHLHRISEMAVVEEVLAAGFEWVANDVCLRVAGDSRTVPAWKAGILEGSDGDGEGMDLDCGSGNGNGNAVGATDRFVLKFRYVMWSFVFFVVLTIDFPCMCIGNLVDVSNRRWRCIACWGIGKRVGKRLWSGMEAFFVLYVSKMI